jgi:hypothetical protein
MINLNLPVMNITKSEFGSVNIGRNVNLIRVKTASTMSNQYKVPLSLPTESSNSKKAYSEMK